MKKYKYLKWIMLVLLILVMAFIFLMSSTNATDSRKESRAISRAVCRVIYRDFDNLPFGTQEARVGHLNQALRKFAHFFEFTLLGSVFYMTLYTWSVKYKIALPVTLGAGIVYALTDELHQGFVEGRATEFNDVFLDALGVFAGGVAVWAVVTAVTRIRAEKEEAAPAVSGTES